MEQQELTTDELMNIEGGGYGNLIYDLIYAGFRTARSAYDLSISLRDNPNYGNAMVYK